jgi:hypothetical protein
MDPQLITGMQWRILLLMSSNEPPDHWPSGDPAPHVQTELPPYGEAVVSWEAIEDHLYPAEFLDRGPTDGGGADDMQRLRGLVVLQAAETEAVLAAALESLGVPTTTKKGGVLPASAMLDRLMDVLVDVPDSAGHVESIRQALEPRNRAVHDRAEIHYTWVKYQTGGGHHEAVASTLGGQLYDERDLAYDLALQQVATVAAVRLLREIIPQTNPRFLDPGLQSR